MTDLVHMATGTPMTFAAFRREHPTTSFPSLDRLTDADLRPYGYLKVIQTPQPAVAPHQRARIAGIDGQALVWVVEDLPAEEIEAQRAAARRNIDMAVSQHIEAQARALGYDSAALAAVRAAFPGPWQAEGVRFATWMDACWQAAYDAMSVDAEPRSLSVVLAALPAWEAP